MLLAREAVEMSTSVADLEALLAEDPTFEEDDEWAQGAPPNQQHRDVIDSIYYLLRDRLAGPTCWVGAEVRVYRDIRAVAARQYREPDLAVAWDRPDAQRVVYLLSEEGKAPDFVLEVLSDSTKDQDARAKKRWYQAIGVREYVIADPSGDYAGERRLQRWRLPGAEEADAAPPDVALEGEVLACAVLPYGLVARGAGSAWSTPGPARSCRCCARSWRKGGRRRSCDEPPGPRPARSWNGG
jgi:Uma2 family endonuclease